jgi:nucleoside-diphosphate-sugar epimerase
MASPVSFSLTDPEKVITPAVKGALVILDSALAHAGPQLEIIVQTSSVAAVYHPREELPYVYTEKDWNNYSEDKVKADGATVTSGVLYQASKAAAEKAVWKWVDEKKVIYSPHHEKKRSVVEQISTQPPFALAAVNPGVVYGAPALLVSSAEKLNETLKPIWQLFSGEAKEVPPFIGTGSFVDVEDVAKANIFSIENPAKVNGQRFILCAGKGMPQAIADILHEEYPDRRDIMPVGNPGEGIEPGYGWPKDGIKVDGGKAERDMGFTYKGLKQSVLETAKAMEKLL